MLSAVSVLDPRVCRPASCHTRASAGHFCSVVVIGLSSSACPRVWSCILGCSVKAPRRFCVQWVQDGRSALLRRRASRRVVAGASRCLVLVVRVALPARLVVWSSGGDCRAVRSWVTRDLGLLSSGWACRPFQWAWEHRDRREGLRLVAILPFGTCSGANLKPSKWSRVPVSDFTLCYKVFLCLSQHPRRLPERLDRPDTRVKMTISIPIQRSKILLKCAYGALQVFIHSHFLV